MVEEKGISLHEWCLPLSPVHGMRPPNCTLLLERRLYSTCPHACSVTNRERRLAATSMSKEDLNRLVLNFLTIEGVRASVRTLGVFASALTRMH